MMNYNIACENLGIDKQTKITKEYLKKMYKMNALKYHPDKNKSPNASIKFQEIHTSYEFLMKSLEYGNCGGGEDGGIDGEDKCGFDDDDAYGEHSGYSGILFSF